MKKFSKLFTFVFIAILSLSFTSCQTDEQQLASYLDGYWDGYIRNNKDTWNVTMQFIQQNPYSRSGYGYEEDHGWRNGSYSRVKFTWSVDLDRRLILLRYNDGTNVEVEYDQLPYTDHLRERFSGMMYTDRNSKAEFYLIKTENHSNRDRDYYDDYGYSKQQTVPAEQFLYN